MPSNEPDVAIDAGDRVGLKLWARYKPGRSIRKVVSDSCQGLLGARSSVSATT